MIKERLEKKNVWEISIAGGAFSGRLVSDKDTYSPTDNIELVDIISIDHLVREEKFRSPEIMKIDVEGNEYLVLEGMKNILDIHNPIIICELHTHLGESSDDVINLLSGYGYSIFDVNGFFSEKNHSIDQLGISRVGHIIAIKY